MNEHGTIVLLYLEGRADHTHHIHVMASSTVFDVIVVGAGVEGSATAYQLIKNGAKRVLLLEQVT